MAPGYRNQNRRQNRTGYVDHDVYEGLPVRQWRRDYITVGPAPSPDPNASKDDDIWEEELPYDMPKDSHLLAQHSQDLLRAARSGRIYRRPPPPEEDDTEVEGPNGEKLDKKDDETKSKGFSVKSWKQIPRHLEGPDIEYLAKRRRGVITIGSKAPKPIPTVTKAKLKRIDAAGNEYVQDVIVPHGQKVEGVVISQVEIPDPSIVAANGLAVVPTPPRRKPVIRKKTKGPGRGRRKKPAAPTSAPIISQLERPTESIPAPSFGPEPTKIESEGSVPAQHEDAEMHDVSAAPSDDETSEDGEEGDDGEMSLDHTSPSKPPRRDHRSQHSLPSMPKIPDLSPEDRPMPGLNPHLHPHPTLRFDKEAKSGSPLKNVAMSTSALASPLEAPYDGSGNPFAATAVSGQESEIQKLDEDMQQEVAPEGPVNPTEDLIPVSVEAVKEELEEEPMLLDAGPGDIAINKEDQVIQELAAPEVQVVETEAQAAITESKVEGDEASDTDDDFPDLLGDLEKSLQRTAPVAEASKESTEPPKGDGA